MLQGISMITCDWCKLMYLKVGRSAENRPQSGRAILDVACPFSDYCL